MNDNELRVGNYVKIYNQDTIIQTVGSWCHAQNQIDERPVEDFQPIPLTEEWLIKFGFDLENDDGNGNLIIFEDINHIPSNIYLWCFPNNETGAYIFIGENVGSTVTIKYVHQLQNLYFALTGEELTIKELAE